MVVVGRVSDAVGAMYDSRSGDLDFSPRLLHIDHSPYPGFDCQPAGGS